MKAKTQMKLMFIKRIMSKPLGSKFTFHGDPVSRFQCIRLGLMEIEKMFSDSS